MKSQSYADTKEYVRRKFRKKKIYIGIYNHIN